MRFPRAKRTLLAGALVAALAAGGAGVLVLDDIDDVFAQEGQRGEVELDGIVEARPADGPIGTWQISGTTVLVTDATEIDRSVQALTIGSGVEVEGIPQTDGSILATDLEADDLDDDDND